MHFPLAAMTHGQALGVGIAVIVAIASVFLFFIFSLVMAIVKKSGGWLAATICSGVISAALVFTTGGIYYLAQKHLAARRAAAAASGPATLTSVPESGPPVASTNSAAPTAPATLRASAAYQIAASPDGKVNFEVPDGWTARTPSKATTLMSAMGPHEQSLVVVRIQRTALSETLAEQSARQTEALEKQLKSGVASVPSSEPVGSYPAIRHVITGEAKSFRTVFHTADIETPDAFYHVVTSTPKSRETIDPPMLERIISSFTLK